MRGRHFQRRARGNAPPLHCLSSALPPAILLGPFRFEMLHERAHQAASRAHEEARGAREAQRDAQKHASDESRAGGDAVEAAECVSGVLSLHCGANMLSQ